MIVCAHGEVSEYCESHDMVIVGRYTGDIEGYNGVCPVLVTDQDMSQGEYYFLKGKMLARGVELVSTRYPDSKNLAKYEIPKKPTKYGGRQRFGTGSDFERAVIQRIFELADAGKTLREIAADEKVGYLDGRKMSISTIQLIIKNRGKYEVKG